MEDEDKQTLKTVQDGENVRYNEGLFIDVHEPKRPGQTQEYNQHRRAFQPCPVWENKNSNVKSFCSLRSSEQHIWYLFWWWFLQIICLLN